MNFALLGGDLLSRELARAIAANARHRLVWGSELGDFEAEFRQLAPAATIALHWETLLADSTADALVIGLSNDEEARAEQLRKLLQAGLPMIAVHPAHREMLVAYELEMIRRESHCPVVPYAPLLWHPAIERLQPLLSAGQPGLGSLEQLVVERQMLDRSKPAVQAQFAADVLVARSLAGDLNKLSALAPADEAQRYSNLGMQLSGTSGAVVRWSVGPVAERPGLKLTLLASGGRAQVLIPDSGAGASISITVNGETSLEEYTPAGGAADRALEQLELARQGGDPWPTWSDACQAIELADSIDRALDKGRTLELHFEDYTEQATFKGTMTSLGCGLLVVALVSLPLAALAAKLGLPVARHWGLILLAICVLFLLMQALRLVFPTPKTARD